MKKRLLFSVVALAAAMSASEANAFCVEPSVRPVVSLYGAVSHVSTGEATVSHPAYVSDSLKNAACTSLDGWTAVADKNSIGKKNEWEHASGNYQSEDGTFVVTDYIQRYRASAGVVGLSNSKLSQTVENMPKGIYRVSADLLANITTNLTNNVDGYHGVTFSVLASEKSASESVASLHNKAIRKTVLVIVGDDGKLSVELETSGTNCNWVFISNVQMEYLGEGSLSLIDLDKAITQYQDSLATLTSDDKCNAAVKDSLLNAITTGQMLIERHSADEDDINYVMSRLSESWNDIKENVAAYQELSLLYQEVMAKIAGMDEETYPRLVELKAFLDGKTTDYPVSIKNLYRNCTYTTPTLKDYMAQLRKLLEYVFKSGVTPGRDVTADVVANPSFSQGTDGWQGLEGTGLAVSPDYQNAEAYETTFNVGQTITEIPDGYYELSVQAMQRVADNATAYEQHENGTEQINAYLYANGQQAKLHSVYDSYMTTPSAEEGYNADWTPAGEEGVYYANSMQGFKKAVDEGLYRTALHVKVTDGTLHFGVRCDTLQAERSWTIFDNFRLKYLGLVDCYTLSEDSVNYFVQASNVNVDVTCTLDSAVWNTFCVPFSISGETVRELFGENTQLRTYAGAEGNTLHFASADSIEAGKAYLVKPEKSVKDMAFKNVDITQSAEVEWPDSVTEYQFVGVYGRFLLPSDSTVLTVTADGKTQVPSDSTDLFPGMHAFILVPDSMDRQDSVVLDLGDDVTLTVRSLPAAATLKQGGRVYRLDGQLAGESLRGLRKGIYVVDGRKIIIR